MGDGSDFERLARDIGAAIHRLLGGVHDPAFMSGSDSTTIRKDDLLGAVVELERTRAWAAGLGQTIRAGQEEQHRG